MANLTYSSTVAQDFAIEENSTRKNDTIMGHLFRGITVASTETQLESHDSWNIVENRTRSRFSNLKKWIRRFVLYSGRLGFSIVVTMGVLNYSYLIFFFLLAIVVLPVVSVIWSADRKFGCFFAYYYVIIITLVFYATHFDISSLSPYALAAIGLMTAIPLGILFLVHLQRTLPPSALGLLPWCFAILHSILMAYPQLRPDLWPSSFYPFTTVGIVRVYLTAFFSLILAVVAMAIANFEDPEEGSFRAKGEGFLSWLRQGPFIVMDQFL